MFNPLPYSSWEKLEEGSTHFNRDLTLSGFTPAQQKQLSEKPDRLGHSEGIALISAAVTGQGEAESYDIAVRHDRISVTANDQKGLFYAVQTLLSLMEEPEVPCVRLHNSPVCPFRGVKVFLPEPSEKGLSDFRQLIDFIARFRYNTLVIEIGGAMEYKRHPEINEGWLEYAAFMNEYSGKPNALFKKIPWRKNSVHATNGGGKVVSQDQMRELLSYCRERGLEVIPELPSLSHCDFLLTRHPELAERPDDPYPDTVCPNHPDYYPLLFDIVDELIEVFNPRCIHMGHDEYVSVGVCPRCQGKKAPEIYAEDIRKCYDYLKQRNIEMMIWSEKLLDGRFPGTGDPCGGACIRVRKSPEVEFFTPATWPAIDLIPRDIQLMHWYWGIDRQGEKEFISRNMPVIFGNFRADCLPDWKNRRQAANFTGTCSSNWGSMDWLTMQRNTLLSEIVYTSALHWNPDLDSDDYPEIRDWALDELYRERISREKGRQAIQVLHTTTHQEAYHYFYDGILVEKEKDLLGWHVFQDETGKEIRCPVYYGCNITCQDVSMEQGELQVDMWKKNHVTNPEDIYWLDRRFWEVSYETHPELVHGRLFCRCIYPLPENIVKLSYKGFTPAEGFTENVRLADFRLVSC